MKKNKNKKIKKRVLDERIPKPLHILALLALLVMPIVLVLLHISTHSELLVIPIAQYLLAALFGMNFAYVIIYAIITKGFKKSILKKIVSWVLLVLCLLCCIGGELLLYGPFDTFRNWLIITAMDTMSHQYLCKWFYDDATIKDVYNNNYLVEVDEQQNMDLVVVDSTQVANLKSSIQDSIAKWNAQILLDNENYMILIQKVNDQNCYVVFCYDPSKVILGKSRKLNSGTGDYVTKQAEIYGALLGINGGGFHDPGANSAGGNPLGLTISQGRVISSDTTSKRANGGLIGFNSEDKLVLIKNINAEEALEQGIRDAVTWGPFLVVNGKSLYVSGNGGMGKAARTAIGQRTDGIVIMIVVDSNGTRSKGASMKDLAEIMTDYGAINAANLDGGTSSVLALPSDVALSVNEYAKTAGQSTAYRFLNDPVDSKLRHKSRPVADSWLLLP